MIIWLCSSDSLKSFHLLCSRLLYSYSQWFSNYFHHILAIEKKNFNKTLVWNSRPSVNYPKATFPALSLTALWQNLYWSQESGRLSIPRKCLSICSICEFAHALPSSVMGFNIPICCNRTSLSMPISIAYCFLS